MTPSCLAIGCSSFSAFVWSLIIRFPKSLIAWLLPFCSASFPNSTSPRLISAAVWMKAFPVGKCWSEVAWAATKVLTSASSVTTIATNDQFFIAISPPHKMLLVRA